jgi:SOS-response transcriptional repressor LexA
MKEKMMVLVSDNKEYDPIIVNTKNTCVTLLGSLFMIIRKVG